MMHARHAALAALASAIVLLAGCGGDGNGGGDKTADGGAGAGREVFVSTAEPSCRSCHTLADADATGTVGPNLDELQPSSDQVAQAVRSGPGVMPSYKDTLSDDQIEAVAAYVAGAAG